MIEVGRNSIIVRNVDKESSDFKKSRFKFSLYDKVVHKYIMDTFIEINDDLYFPASIGVDALKLCFPKKEIIDTTLTSTVIGKNISYKMKHDPRNDLQEKAIKFIMSMKNDSCRDRFLSLSTGSGKTYITINVASKFKKKTMVIVDTVDLAEQWKREFLNHTDLCEDDIKILSGSDSVESAIKNKNIKIFISIHRTLSNLINKDTNSMNKLMRQLGIGFRVFDESHVNFKNICSINALSNVEYTLYLTATPNRSKFNDDYLYGTVFRNIPFFNGKEIQQENYHTIIFHNINSNPPLSWKSKIKTKYGFSSARWAQYIFESAYDILEEDILFLFEKLKLVERKKKTAIMLPTIDLIKKVKKTLEENFKDISIGTFIGEVPKAERAEQLDKMFILTNDKIFEKGIDVQDLEILISYVQLGSTVKLEQIIGRLRYKKGKSSIYIDVCDNGFIETINQFKIRKRFLKKKAKKIIEFTEKN